MSSIKDRFMSLAMSGVRRLRVPEKFEQPDPEDKRRKEHRQMLADWLRKPAAGLLFEILVNRISTAAKLRKANYKEHETMLVYQGAEDALEQLRDDLRSLLTEPPAHTETDTDSLIEEE